MKKKVGIIKQVTCLGLVFLLSINSFAAIVSDNDGSAFITKSEFDALKSSFQSQIDNYNQSIDSKIDGAIASYLAGIRVETLMNVAPFSDYDGFKFIDKPVANKSDLGTWGRTGWFGDIALCPAPCGGRMNFCSNDYDKCVGWVFHMGENRWTAQVNLMKGVWDQEQEKEKMRSGYFFDVTDRTSATKYLNKIRYAQAKVFAYRWKNNADPDDEYIIHNRGLFDFMIGNAVGYMPSYPTNITFESFLPTRLEDDTQWKCSISVHQKYTGKDATYSNYQRAATNQIAAFSDVSDLTKATYGFFTDGSNLPSLVMSDDVHGPDYKKVNVTHNYVVTSLEQHTFADLGYTTPDELKYDAGQKIESPITIQVFDTSKAIGLDQLYSASLKDILALDLKLYEGVPLFRSPAKGEAEIEIEGVSAPKDIIIKKGPFTGWTKSDDLADAITIKDATTETIVTQTPSSGTTQTLKFDVVVGEVYYFKLAPGGEIRIIGDVKINSGS